MDIVYDTLQILHTGPNMWIINHFPWWSFGLEQCVCVDIKEGENFQLIFFKYLGFFSNWFLQKILGGDDANPNPIYPIQPQWVDNLIYIGREIIGVEYLKEKDEDLTDVSTTNQDE